MGNPSSTGGDAHTSEAYSRLNARRCQASAYFCLEPPTRAHLGRLLHRIITSLLGFRGALVRARYILPSMVPYAEDYLLQPWSWYSVRLRDARCEARSFCTFVCLETYLRLSFSAFYRLARWIRPTAVWILSLLRYTCLPTKDTLFILQW
ncbi:hypothetical protein GQ53DRAFT_355901 [Thozetella sp. PMI_491]|nr:hypothetical protein GQ53DRAFT_355901 [Thozetella sp. PMI_491]